MDSLPQRGRQGKSNLSLASLSIQPFITFWDALIKYRTGKGTVRWSQIRLITGAKSRWKPVTSSVPQGPVLGQILFNTLVIWMIGQSAPSGDLQTMQNWADPMSVLPLKDPLINWENGSTQISQSSTKGNDKSWTWGRIFSHTSTQWGLLAGKQLYKKCLESPDGHQVDHESSVYTCGKEGQQHPRLYLAEHQQQVNRGNSSFLFSPREIDLKCWIQC